MSARAWDRRRTRQRTRMLLIEMFTAVYAHRAGDEEALPRFARRVLRLRHVRRAATAYLAGPTP